MKYLITALLAASLSFSATLSTSAQMMGMGAPTAQNAKAFRGAHPGAAITLALRIQTVSRSTVTAQILDPQGGKNYRATRERATLYFSSDAPVVMGARDDVKAGALVIADVIVTKAGHGDLKRVVVLNSYMSVH